MMRPFLLFLFIIMSAAAGIAQENRILVIGKGIEQGDEGVVSKIIKDLANDPAAVILMGDYLENRHRIDQNFLISSSSYACKAAPNEEEISVFFMTAK
ncbi:MAG: hypothetical protein P8X57_00715 [Cyclobacteriaceae bacterium]